jgi:hypothetical protein
MRRASPSNRIRPRLSRTLSRARWPEYRSFLQSARRHGYSLVSLETWVSESVDDAGGPVLILRHDIDQHPRSALAMARPEMELGARSSWYFRWRTAHPAVVAALKDAGFDVGLHYETLTRKALERGVTESPGEALIEESRRCLREEIAAFQRRFGPIRSAVPHGDSRVPAVRNSDLLHGEVWADYGIEFDGNQAMQGRGLGFWLTDRSAAEGHWKDRIIPEELFAAGTTPILCVTHPNNWASGPSLWVDRAIRRILPMRLNDAGPWPSRPIRTGSDQPP